MNRRSILKNIGILGLSSMSFKFAKGSSQDFVKESSKAPQDRNAAQVDQRPMEPQNDRAYWVALITQIASPILSTLSKQQFRLQMPMEVSPSFDKRDPGVGYLEAFGRLMAGIAPWLALPDDSSTEGQLRVKFRKQALLGIQYSVDPGSPDYFSWRVNSSQTLVDAAHLAQAFLRAPKALWEPLPALTKAQVITEFKRLRAIKPNESNWLLFSAMVETFLASVGESPVVAKIDYAIEKFDSEWYVGDGWYSDGASFSFDHYNGHVIHSMLVDTLQHNRMRGAEFEVLYERAYKRMQRYGHHLERMISPEGTYLVVGRSSTYRTAAFQPLSQLVLDQRLPEDLSNGQIRAALTAIKKRLFIPETFSKSGWLTMGLIGAEQQNLADYYTNAGSMYVTSLSFLPLGLPADHDFWTCPAEKWTSQKAWSGKQFPKDYYITY